MNKLKKVRERSGNLSQSGKNNVKIMKMFAIEKSSESRVLW